MRTLFRAALLLSAGGSATLAQPRTGRITLANASIPYEVTGRGAPVVFINGWTQNYSIWDEQVPPFSRRYTVVRYDPRGFGQSTGAADPTEAPADLLALLDSLHLQKAALVGLSMGSEIALHFAVAYPDRVSALVLYGAAPSAQDYTVPPPQELRVMMQSRPAIVKNHGLDSLKQFLFASPIAWHPPNRPDIVTKLERAWVGYTAADLLDPKPPSGHVPPIRMKQINDVRVPTLVIYGDHEVPWFAQFDDTLMARLPNAKRVIIKDGGHGAHFAQPEQFNAAVLGFLDALRLR